MLDQPSTTDPCCPVCGEDICPEDKDGWLWCSTCLHHWNPNVSQPTTTQQDIPAQGQPAGEGLTHGSATDSQGTTLALPTVTPK